MSHAVLDVTVCEHEIYDPKKCFRIEPLAKGTTAAMHVFVTPKSVLFEENTPMLTVIPIGAQFDVYPICAERSCVGVDAAPYPAKPFKFLRFVPAKTNTTAKTLRASYEDQPPGWGSVAVDGHESVPVNGGRLTVLDKAVDTDNKRWYLGAIVFKVQTAPVGAVQHVMGKQLDIAEKHAKTKFGVYFVHLATGDVQMYVDDDRCINGATISTDVNLESSVEDGTMPSRLTPSLVRVIAAQN